MQRTNKIIFSILVGAIIVSIGVGGMQQHRKNNIGLANSGLEEKALAVGNTILQVEVAQTVEQRMTGLSHRSALAEGRGMFFIFDTDDTHGIWMKDMQFAIDIIWIDATMKIVHIEQAVTPDTYPQSFTPPVPARYVLEVPAGYMYGKSAVGESVTLQNP